MRPQRLLVLGGLIAAALVWLFLVLPRPPSAPRAPVGQPPPASAPAPAISPARRAVAKVENEAPAEPPPDLPPQIPVAPLAEPSNEPPPLPPPGPIDSGHAADLFAGLLAAQESAEGEAESAPALWRRFSAERADEAWASVLTPEITQSVQEWIDTLPESVRDHVAVVRVDCRATLCQILVADNDPATLEMRAALRQEWARSSDVLLAAPWWQEAGLNGLSQQAMRSGDYTLTVTYLLRGDAPAAH